MRFVSLSVVILLLLAQSAVSAECQYTVNSTTFKEVQNLYELGTDRFITDSLEIRNLTAADRSGSFEIYNKFDVPVTIRLTFDYGFSVFAGPRQRISNDTTMTIPRQSFKSIQIGPNQTIWARFEFYNDTMKYAFLDNNETYQKYETVGVTREACKTCLGQTCRDDGAVCSANAECGGGYCIEHRCNGEPTCYAMDCGCSADEVQCPDNDMCMPRNVLDLGAEPICSPLECKTNYTDSSTNECAIKPKSAETLEAEDAARTADAGARKEMLSQFVLAVIAIVVFFYLALEIQRRMKESDLEKREAKRAKR